MKAIYGTPLSRPRQTRVPLLARLVKSATGTSLHVIALFFAQVPRYARAYSVTVFLAVQGSFDNRVGLLTRRYASTGFMALPDLRLCLSVQPSDSVTSSLTCRRSRKRTFAQEKGRADEGRMRAFPSRAYTISLSRDAAQCPQVLLAAIVVSCHM